MRAYITITLDDTITPAKIRMDVAVENDEKITPSALQALQYVITEFIKQENSTKDDCTKPIPDSTRN